MDKEIILVKRIENGCVTEITGYKSFVSEEKKFDFLNEIRNKPEYISQNRRIRYEIIDFNKIPELTKE